MPHFHELLTTRPIAITMGEPAGVGPDIILQRWQQQPDLFSSYNLIVIGNKQTLADRAKLLKITGNIDEIPLIDIPLKIPSTPRQLNPENASFVIEMLTLATKLALQHKISAIVTGPIHKSVINDAGFSYAGHTDFFSKHTQCDTVMMLMTASLKVALFSDHLPLRDVSHFLTTEKLTRCLRIIIRDFQEKLAITHPRVLVCGLNPHAGEQGYLGHEEQTIIEPVLQQFRAEGYTMIGPVGADVAFTKKYRDNADVIVAMYHDQGLPVLKYAGFDEAINVTLGLPFIRTSVDHGTALDIAGTGSASTLSLYEAILFASTLVKQRKKLS